MFLKIKDAMKESQNSTKTKYILLIHSPAELIFGIQQSHVIRKQPQCSSNKHRRGKILSSHTIPYTHATSQKI